MGSNHYSYDTIFNINVAYHHEGRSEKDIANAFDVPKRYIRRWVYGEVYPEIHEDYRQICLTNGLNYRAEMGVDRARQLLNKRDN